MAQPASTGSPAAPPVANDAAADASHGNSYWVMLGIGLLGLPLVLMVAAFLWYTWSQSDSIVENWNEVQRAEAAAAGREAAARHDKQQQLVAEFQDAFSRENLTAAHAVLERMEAAEVDEAALAECRKSLEAARRAATPDSPAGFSAGPNLNR